MVGARSQYINGLIINNVTTQTCVRDMDTRLTTPVYAIERLEWNF